MRSKTSTIKCATCEFWTGKRDPVFDARGTPVIDIFDTYGECQNVNSRFCDAKREQKAKCKHFSKWTELF